MKEICYISTRGDKSVFSSSQAIVRGIAEDGGLFVPTEMPKLSSDLNTLIELNYRDLAYEILKLFLTDFTEEELKYCINSAYDEKFDTPVIAPIAKAKDNYFLELFHGPTLAFKDMALTILPYLLKTSAKKLNIDSEIVILTATSGDTGKAALEGFANIDGIKIIVYFPQNGVSEVQKKQMITQEGFNTYVVGIEGNFDDAQSGVKNIFTDEDFNGKLKEKGFMFSSANSINIGRLVPQVVYYFYAYAQMCKSGDIKVGDEINFVVPTGNFGNILAGYYAKELGLPVGKLICASNENKVLFDFMATGTYDKKRAFILTMSPSMDILISSNLERLLYTLSGQDSSKVKDLMDKLNSNGVYNISDDMKQALKDFVGGYASEENTTKAIKDVFENSDYLMDTHTAVAYSVYKEYKDSSGDDRKTVIVSTASPYKFTANVMKAIDSKYDGQDEFELMNEMETLSKVIIPESIRDLNTKPILHTTICAKDEMKQQVEKILNI
ncbi:threonine synthase [Serpentinicella alkaliphila]|uniref:Threonine synthase n=1 Tax=Serpentinicella alkaliphila TaxID=1734049 RepID=A0A4R2THV6_9FIRM|nr:threonine synthase [Serpentinicella alkaliphila]QUH24662.1 threonine synthase [Serpentinicella alkaliphila]TCQ03078.1 L-threonine synthase [Serpentinicella alkaliphila]